MPMGGSTILPPKIFINQSTPIYLGEKAGPLAFELYIYLRGKKIIKRSPESSKRDYKASLIMSLTTTSWNMMSHWLLAEC